jgi:gamma-glutamylcyclotransferase (GGCT)/AIG2-like uncharacterized protein YtfP
VDLLFVYGTLRSEFDNPYAKLLRSQAERVGPATVLGSVFRIAHYPGYRPEPRGTVQGELYRLADPESTFRILDAYEGEEYERIWMDGTGWIYQYRTQPDDSLRIASGDFCRP